MDLPLHIDGDAAQIADRQRRAPDHDVGEFVINEWIYAFAQVEGRPQLTDALTELDGLAPGWRDGQPLTRCWTYDDGVGALGVTQRPVLVSLVEADQRQISERRGAGRRLAMTQLQRLIERPAGPAKSPSAFARRRAAAVPALATHSPQARGPAASRIFAVLIVVVMSGVNIAGSQLVARAQTVVVYVVLGILVTFAIVTIANINPSLLAPAGYPPVRDIVSSVALTFFAFLGFGIVTFTAKDLKEPSRELPRAMFLAIAIAAVIYVAVALGVFGTLTVEAVIAAGPTAVAVAAQPTLGAVGYTLMSVTGLFATAGATNGGLYPAAGLCQHLASTGQFPPIMGRNVADRLPMGLLVSALGAIVLAAGFSLSAIASIGSAAALLVFMIVTLAHFRVRSETGARLGLLLLALATAAIAFLAFVVTTLTTEPASFWTLLAILVISVVLELWWKRTARARGSKQRSRGVTDSGSTLTQSRGSL